MKRAVLLVLGYLLLLQFVVPLLVMIPYVFAQLLSSGHIDYPALVHSITVPAHLLTGLVVIGGYGWYARRSGSLRGLFAMPHWRVGLFGLAAMASLVLLLDPLLSALDLPDQSQQTFDLLLSDWAGFLAVTVTGAIAEELVFRKAVLSALGPERSTAFRMLISALLFGLIHVNPAQVLPAFLLGLLLAWLYLQSGSIALCCLLHMANNLVAASFMLAGYQSVEILPADSAPAVRLVYYSVLSVVLVTALWGVRRYSCLPNR